MKKLIYLIALISLFSCGNKTNSSYQYNEDSLFLDSIEALEKSNEIEETLEFSDYYLFTNSDDKKIKANHINSSITLTFFYNYNKCSLQIYDYTAKKWNTINFVIASLSDAISTDNNDGCTTYYIEGDTDCIIQVYNNKSTHGVYAEIKNFDFDGGIHSCWMSKGEGIDVDYIEMMYGEGTYVGTSVNTDIGSDNDLSSDVYQYSTSTTYTSNSYNSPIISSSIDSEERNTNNHSRYSNYEETDRCVDGVVVYEGDDDFYIVENRNGYTVLERCFGTLYEGQRVRGELNKYGYTYLLKNSNYDVEVKVHIEDYMLTKNKAIEWLGEKKHLKSDDQRDYDTYN